MRVADLKAFARPFAVTEGALAGCVLHYLPYRTIQVERVIQELNALEPEVVYVHADGRRQNDEPPDLKAEREKVEKERQKLIDKAESLNTTPNADKLAKLVVKSDWQRVYNWSIEHQAFWKYEPLVVAVDFPDVDDASPSELRYFKQYWDTRSPNTAERWQVFRAVLGTDTWNALYDGYEATRDRSFAPPAAEGTDDNSPLADGAESTEPS
jgi:hypothetical protein